MDLNQAVVVVTGSARGVGRAIAEGFAAQGARLALVDILPDELQRTADELRAGGTQALPVVADITDPAQVDIMAETVLTLVSGRADALTGRYFAVRYDLDELFAQTDDILANERLTLRIRP